MSLGFVRAQKLALALELCELTHGLLAVGCGATGMMSALLQRRPTPILTHRLLLDQQRINPVTNWRLSWRNCTSTLRVLCFTSEDENLWCCLTETQPPRLTF